MADQTYRVLQVRRGLKADLPTLAVGELGYCTDTKEVFVGTASGNSLLGYDTMSPSNWAGTAPTTFSEALDRIAAVVAAFTGNPIP